MKSKRIDDIGELVQEKGNVSIKELCEIFGVSKNTIRRDIDELVRNGAVEKVYGGIRAIKNPLLPFEQRHDQQHLQKKKIGEVASTFIEDDDIIFIDSGTTTSQIMDHVRDDIRITILTNNLDVINQCTNKPNVTLFVMGSLYKQETRSFVDMDTNLQNVNFNINKAFIAATGVSIANGLTNSDPLEYEIKKLICSKTDNLFLLVDESKFGKSTLLTYCPLEKISVLITSGNVPHDIREFLEEHEADIMQVDAPK